MSLSMIKRSTILLIIAAFTLGSAASLPRQQSILGCLPTIEKQFGKRVPAINPLYVVNSEYAIEIDPGSNCDVLKISVAPKYAWQEDVPQWTEPDHTVSLTLNQYNEVLAKIGRLKPLGSLIKRSNEKIYY